jgi:superfamily I DNA/RNA helicase
MDPKSARLMKNGTWSVLHHAIQLKYKAIKKIITNTYDGIYVDEYQDCSADQHELVMLLADYLPCRVVGDPLQAIFSQVNKDKALDWSTVVLERFGTIAELRNSMAMEK